MGQPGLFSLFSSTYDTEKTACFSGIRIRIVGVEGEYTEPLPRPKWKFFFLDWYSFIYSSFRVSIKTCYNSHQAINVLVSCQFVCCNQSCWVPPIRVANSLLSQELKLCFSDTKFTKAPYTKKYTRFFLDTKWDTEQYQILSHTKIIWWY